MVGRKWGAVDQGDGGRSGVCEGEVVGGAGAEYAGAYYEDGVG